MKPGDKVRIRANPSRIGILTDEYDGPPNRRRVLVCFLDGDEEFVLSGSLEKVTGDALRPYRLIESGRYGNVNDLRGAITYYRLSGRLANLIYSLNTTNTQFLAYQFKPVLQFLDSPCRGILIADEVGLGKTIEAGLIWTELRARLDARKLLVVCPAMLREKWRDELSNRFGIKAEICDAGSVLHSMQRMYRGEYEEFALVASIQGLRPPRGSREEKSSSRSTAKLATFLEEKAFDDPVFDMVIIDEAHYLRNPETQTHKLGRLLRPTCESLVMLSATPIQMRSRDLFSLLNLLDGDAFPYQNAFTEILEANAPIVQLRDCLLRGPVSQEEFTNALRAAQQPNYYGLTADKAAHYKEIFGESQEVLEFLRKADESLRDTQKTLREMYPERNGLFSRIFQDNQQIHHLLKHPPSQDELSSHQGRSLLAERLDRINPLAKVITRTRKRDVQEVRVVRCPVLIRAEMTPVEAAFYSTVTEGVREFCDGLDIQAGFMLTIPQTQMASCMAAACRAWSRKAANDAELEETIYEVYGGHEENNKGRKSDNLGNLTRTLINITNEIGNYQELRRVDSKYNELVKSLKNYWLENPGKKVVLFSFYRGTLRYLHERLDEDGVRAIVVMGGMDKHAAINSFADPSGPDILLSSEVAAEGVDLQFSSLIVNYDLPWNPMRIEQRIGRIDRIGQEAERILIWNFLYADSIDERIYNRLLVRLNIFEQALGSIEAMLGEQIRELGYDLLAHKLTAEEEAARIDQAALALENINRTEESLEKEATHLIAHGEYIQNQVKAAREIGRYVTSEDLSRYVRGFFVQEYEGSRFIQQGDEESYQVELSVEAKVHLQGFLDRHHLTGKTRILRESPPVVLFENQVGARNRDRRVEIISQYHPVIRFVSEELRAKGKAGGYFPVSAVEVNRLTITDVETGTYVYAISRWSFVGARDFERLEYAVKRFETGEWLDNIAAERLVNIAAMNGRDWFAAQSILEHEQIAKIYDACLENLEARFSPYKGDIQRENNDRVNLMINTMERHRETQAQKIEDRISQYNISENERKIKLIPAEKGKLNKLNKKIDERIAVLQSKQIIQASEGVVSGGVIRVY